MKPSDHSGSARAAATCPAWQSRAGALAAALMLSISTLAGAQPAADTTTAPRAKTYEPTVGQPGKDVVWVPTPDVVVERMLAMAEVKPKDFLVDLGSGDGKIAIAAAKLGARARGIEYNPDMVALSKRNAKAADVRNVEFVQGDIFKSDFSKADVVTLYLLPELNVRLRPILLDMKPGTRIASHNYGLGDWEPDQAETIGSHKAMFWQVPAKVAGSWTVSVADNGAAPLRLNLRQRYQHLGGDATWGSGDAELRDAKISGANISFAVADPTGALQRFEGTADNGGRMSGTVVTEGTSQKRPFTARRQ